MKYDFIEIGTSNFRCLGKDTNLTGISIEPIKYYLDCIPDRKGLYKENIAISDKEDFVNLHYIDPVDIDRLGLPQWLKGCNSIGVHKTAIQYVKMHNLSYKLDKVKCYPLEYIFKKYEVKELDFLKVDTEGHDYYIMKDFFSLKNKPKIKKIQFESNSLMSKDHKKELHRLAIIDGWNIKTVIERGNEDTILIK